MSRPRSKASGRGAEILAARARGAPWKVIARDFGCTPRTVQRELEAFRSRENRRQRVLSHISRVLSHLGDCTGAAVSASLGPVLTASTLDGGATGNVAALNPFGGGMGFEQSGVSGGGLPLPPAPPGFRFKNPSVNEPPAAPTKSSAAVQEARRQELDQRKKREPRGRGATVANTGGVAGLSGQAPTATRQLLGTAAA